MAKDLISLPKELGTNLRLLRTITDKTLDEVASVSGLSKSFISLVESGNRSIKPFDLKRLLAVYNYTLSWFLSKTQDTIEGFIFEPSALVQTKNHSLLLEGSRKEGSLCILLLRPMRHEKDTEFMEIYLPAETVLSETFTTVEGEVRGVVILGTLLIEMKDKEYIIREREEFCFDGQKPHIFRNFTSIATKVLLTITHT